MLVLSRRIGEEIVIDGTTRVLFLGVQGKRIRLGIVAPPEIAIQRKEVRNRENRREGLVGHDLACDREANRVAVI